MVRVARRNFAEIEGVIVTARERGGYDGILSQMPILPISTKCPRRGACPGSPG